MGALNILYKNNSARKNDVAIYEARIREVARNIVQVFRAPMRLNAWAAVGEGYALPI